MRRAAEINILQLFVKQLEVRRSEFDQAVSAALAQGRAKGFDFIFCRQQMNVTADQEGWEERSDRQVEAERRVNRRATTNVQGVMTDRPQQVILQRYMSQHDPFRPPGRT